MCFGSRTNHPINWFPTVPESRFRKRRTGRSNGKALPQELQSSFGSMVTGLRVSQGQSNEVESVCIIVMLNGMIYQVPNSCFFLDLRKLWEMRIVDI